MYIRDFNQAKFQANAKPAIFAGYRVDTGLLYNGVYLALDPRWRARAPIVCRSANRIDAIWRNSFEAIPNIDVPFFTLETNCAGS